MAAEEATGTGFRAPGSSAAAPWSIDSVIHHILAVPLGGGRACAFVEIASTSPNSSPAIIWIRKSSYPYSPRYPDPPGSQTWCRLSVVHHQNIGDAFIIQGLNDVVPIKPAPPVTMIITVTFELWVRDNLRHEYFYHITTRRWLHHSPKVRLMDVIYPEFCRSVTRYLVATYKFG